jgi:hypothetical protein
MNNEPFRRLLATVGTYKIFNISPSNSHHRHKQCAVWIQLACVLHQLGCDGHGVSVGFLARNCGFSNGSVINFRKRVFKAILSPKNQIVIWSDANERKEISRRFANEQVVF